MAYGSAFCLITTGIEEALPYLLSLVTNPEQLSPLAAVQRVEAGGLAALVRAPLSSNAILRRLKAAGMGVRRQNGLKAIASAKQMVAQLQLADGLGGNEKIPRGWYLPSPKTLQHNYHDVIGFPATSDVTGERALHYVTVVHDRPMSANELYGEAQASSFAEYDLMDVNTGAMFVAERWRRSG